MSKGIERVARAIAAVVTRQLKEPLGPQATIEWQADTFLITLSDCRTHQCDSADELLKRLPLLAESDIAEIRANGFILVEESLVENLHFSHADAPRMYEDLLDFEEAIEIDDRFGALGCQFALAQHPEHAVRAELARVRSDLHPDVILRLAKDEVQYVRCVVAEFQPIPTHRLHEMLDENRVVFARAICGNRHINVGSPALFERLIDHAVIPL